MNKLEKQFSNFANERIAEELYENGIDDNKYGKEFEKIINFFITNLEKDSKDWKMIYKLQDLHVQEIVYRDEKSYALGFYDGMNLEKSMKNLSQV